MRHKMSLREKTFTLILLTISMLIMIVVDIVVVASVIYTFNISNLIYGIVIFYGISIVLIYWWIKLGLAVSDWYDWHRSYN